MELRIVIDDRIVNAVKRVLTRRKVGGVLAATAIAAGGIVYAKSVSKPYTFADGNTISAAQVNANFDEVFSHVAAQSDVVNLKGIVSKGSANGFCPSGSTAIHTPWAYRGQTGNQICAADARGKSTCAGVIYMYVTNANSVGGYANGNLSCGSNVSHPWPWGNLYDVPNTLDGEWGHGDTWVVCCK